MKTANKVDYRLEISRIEAKLCDMQRVYDFGPDYEALENRLWRMQNPKKGYDGRRMSLVVDYLRIRQSGMAAKSKAFYRRLYLSYLADVKADYAEYLV